MRNKHRRSTLDTDRLLRTADRFSKSKGDFFRESLIIQRQYAEYVIVFVDFFSDAKKELQAFR